MEPLSVAYFLALFPFQSLLNVKVAPGVAAIFFRWCIGSTSVAGCLPRLKVGLALRRSLVFLQEPQMGFHSQEQN